VSKRSEVNGEVKVAVFVVLGGALGTLFRYLLNQFVFLSSFPLGTMLENLVGSFLLGLLTAFVLERNIPAPWKNGLGVGFCGGFTTMSTFAADTHELFLNGTLFSLALYVTVSLAGGICLALAGMVAGKRLGTRNGKVIKS
jgi:CrcB protein